MISIRVQLAGALTALAALLAALVAAGLGALGTVAGVAYGATLAVAADAGARRAGVPGFGPAGAVTLARAVLVGGVTALVVDVLTAPNPPLLGPVVLDRPLVDTAVALPVLVGLAAVALALDAVDGAVARRTRTATRFGAGLDAELDALTLLVLSGAAVTMFGRWVLLIGLMRYLYFAAGRVLPWLVGELPVQRSAKVVAALQGVALVVAIADVLPHRVAAVLLAAALAALGWSFASSARYRWRHSTRHPVTVRPAAAAALTAAAGALVVVALVVPHDVVRLVPAAFGRVPVEAVGGVVLLALLPARAGRVVATAAGALLGVVLVLALLDLGFDASLARPFDPVLDGSLLANGVEFLTSTLGTAAGVTTAVGVGLAALAAVVATAGAARRLGRCVRRQRGVAVRLGVVGVVVWLTALVTGATVARGLPVAAADGAWGVRNRVVATADGLRDRRAFAAEAASDAYRGTPPADLLGALRGKDVIVAVVESYGATALDDPSVTGTLADGERGLGEAGFAARTGQLVSPIAGGGSWLAHATLYSGLRIGSEGRYRDLTSSTRLTLPRAFRDAGWDTCAVQPGTTRAWPEGAFYGVNRNWSDDRLAYDGPRFSWSPMPDQYALARYQAVERARADRPPQFCEMVLTSSHAPWTPVPQPVPWPVAADPASYASMAGPQRSFNSVFGDPPARVRANYLAATRYSLATLASWIRTYGDDRTVLVVLGDHQPVPAVTGPDAPRTVPISVVARDPAVLARVGGWGWAPGLRPAPSGPIWPMEAFRDRFLDAFSTPRRPM